MEGSKMARRRFISFLMSSKSIRYPPQHCAMRAYGDMAPDTGFAVGKEWKIPPPSFIKVQKSGKADAAFESAPVHLFQLPPPHPGTSLTPASLTCWYHHIEGTTSRPLLVCVHSDKELRKTTWYLTISDTSHTLSLVEETTVSSPTGLD